MAYFHFRAFFIFTSSLVAGQSTTYFIKGTSGHLQPVISGQPNSILWKHDGNKVVEFDGREQTAYSPYGDRITLDWLSAELDITGLRFEDSGVYELEVEINHNLITSKHKLEVIDKVSKPTISCEMNEGSSSDVSKTKATLLCSAEPRKPESLMKFEWNSQGNLHPRPKLTISLGDKLDEEEYSCSVSNPLSSETATFTARECYPGKSSSAALAACLSILFLLLLGTVVAGIVFCKRRQKACFAQKHSNDLEKQSQTEESDKKTAPSEEKRRLLQREETLPSHQRLVQDHNMSPDHPDISRKENNNSGVDERKMDFRKNQEMFERKSKRGQTTPPKDQANRDVHNKYDKDANQLQEPARVTLPENSDTEKANNQDRASTPEESGEEAQSDLKREEAHQSDHSDSEDNNEPDPANVKAQSPEANRDVHNKYDKDANQLQEPARVTLPENSDTEKANNQDRASTPEESGEEAQSDLKPEETHQSDHSESEGNYEPDPADVQAQSPEGDQNAVQPEETADIPPPDSNTVEANNQDRVSPLKELHKEAEPSLKPEEASQSDHSESEGENGPNPADVPGQSSEDKPDEQPGSDEGTAQDGGNSPLLVDAATPTSDRSADCYPAGDNTTPGDHASNQNKDKDSEQGVEGKVPEGYVHSEADRIDKKCIRDGQTALIRGRGSESNRHKNTAVVSPSSSPGSEASLEQDPNPPDNMNNGDPETDQHEKTEKDVLQSDTTDPPEKNKQGQADESHSDNGSSDEPPANPTDVQAQSPEGDPNAVQPKEPANAPLTDSSNTVEVNNRGVINKESEPGLKPEEAPQSDHSDSESKNGPNPADVSGQSSEEKPDKQPGSDEGTGQDGGNSPPVVDTATPTSDRSADCLPAGGDTTPDDHANYQNKDKDSGSGSTSAGAISSSTSPGAEAPLEQDPNPNDYINNEPNVRAGEDKELSKEKSGSDLVNTETEKTVKGSDSSDTQQNGDLSGKTAEEESSNVPVKKDSDKKSEEDSRQQQTVTHTEEAKDQQETHNSQQSVTSSSTEVNTINNDNKSPNTAQENPAEEESDSQTPEGGHSEGETSEDKDTLQKGEVDESASMQSFLTRKEKNRGIRY